LYVSKTSGSGNAMAVVGGRTSLVDLALSSVTNTAGDFLTLSGGVVHKRTAAQTLTDIGGQAALTNPVTGTGDTNTLPKFTGSTTIGNSLFTDNGTNGAFGGTNYSAGTGVRTFNISASLYPGLAFWANNTLTGSIFSYTFTGNLFLSADPTNVFADTRIAFDIDGGERFAIFNNGNVTIANSPANNGFKLDVSGTGRFTSNLTAASFIKSGGISTEYLMADGSVTTLSNPVTGTGTTGQVAYFNGTSSITGESNLFWNSTNDRLGIGTANPDARITILWDKSTRFAGQSIYDSQAFNTSNLGGNIAFGGTFNTGGDVTEWAAIGGIKSNTTSGDFAGDLVLYTRPNGSAMAERVRVTSNGYLWVNGAISGLTGSAVQMQVNGQSRFGGTIILHNGSDVSQSIRLSSNGADSLYVEGTGTFTSNLTAASFIRSGGTSSQFLKADGSVDSTTYVSSVTASSPLFSSGGTTPNITIQQASGSQNGFLSSTDWTTFNNKQNTLTLTTSGTSGAATLVGSTLNIPNYSADLSGYLPLTGGTLTGGLGGTTASFSSTVSATQFFVNTSGQSRAISTFHPAGAFGSNIWIGGGGANSTLGGGGSALGSTNTSLGVFALEDNTTGYANVAIGYLSLSNNTTGNANTSAGQFSMWKNTTGYSNSAFGTNSLIDNTTGFANCAFGTNSLGYLTTGRYNVGFGSWAGYLINSGAENRTSIDSVYLGDDTRASADGNENEIVIGKGGRGQGSNSAIIGNANITKTILRGNVGINTVVPSIYSKLSVAGAISFNNNTDSAVSDNNYGQAFSRRVTVTAGAGVVSIKPALGSEASLILVTGRSGTGVRFSDVVLVIGQGTTAPIVIASRELSGPASRSYTNGGENLRVQLTGGSETYTVYVTGIGGNEMT
jgi:hypothetical protein